MVKAYNDYKDKSLVVLGITGWDKLDATKKAMVNLSMYYPQLLDPNAMLAERFDIIGIPYLILFGPDGQIIQEGLRNEKTDALLSHYFQ